MLIIHTYGRPDYQPTLNAMLKEGLAVTLAVQEREQHLYDKYRDEADVLVLPPELTKLAPTRQWLFENVTPMGERICILDDDLKFAIRREDTPDKLRSMEPGELRRAFSDMYCNCCAEVPLVGFSAREGANRNVEPVLRCTRQMRAHMIHVPTYLKLGIRFDRVTVMEDFDVTLQFIRWGLPNLVLNNYTTNQPGSNTKGGCSHYRTDEVQADSARGLAALHPGIVSVVQKETKGAWGGGVRTDVRVQWKKALQRRYRTGAGGQ